VLRFQKVQVPVCAITGSSHIEIKRLLENILCAWDRPVIIEKYCYYLTSTCQRVSMKRAIDNAVADEVKRTGVKAHLASVMEAQPSYSKSARQAAFSKRAIRLSVDKVVSDAKLISNVDPAEFRTVRMPG
jgi:hypothetical protein